MSDLSKLPPSLVLCYSIISRLRCHIYSKTQLFYSSHTYEHKEYSEVSKSKKLKSQLNINEGMAKFLWYIDSIQYFIGIKANQEPIYQHWYNLKILRKYIICKTKFSMTTFMCTLKHRHATCLKTWTGSVHISSRVPMRAGWKCRDSLILFISLRINLSKSGFFCQLH